MARHAPGCASVRDPRLPCSCGAPKTESVYPTAIHYELNGPAGGASGCTQSEQRTPQSTGSLLKCPDEIAVRVSQRAAELPRRTTSEQWPHILLVTMEELQFIVTDEINKGLLPREGQPLDHYFTADPTKRFCTICGDKRSR